MSLGIAILLGVGLAATPPLGPSGGSGTPGRKNDEARIRTSHGVLRIRYQKALRLEDAGW